MKNKIEKGFAPIIILLAVLVLSGIAGGMVYFSNKTNQPTSVNPQPTSSQQENLFPTNQPQISVAPVDETANWKIYSDSTYGFEFKYPSNFVGPKNGSEMGYKQIEYFNEQNSSGKIMVGIRNTKTGMRLGSIFDNPKFANAPKLTTASGLVGIVGGTGAVFFRKDEQSDEIEIGCVYDERSLQDTRLVDKRCEIIYLTFHFIDKKTVNSTPSPTSSSKQLTYALPSGWKTARDKKNTIEIGYNPQTNEPSIDYSPNGIAATGKWGSNPTRKLAGNFTSGIGSYDGGSKHTNLFKGLSAEELKTGNWKAPDYFEKEYTYNNWPCLVVFGFYVSQWPVTQGMCVISNSKAVYFSADTKNPGEVETFMQTIKIL